MVGNMADNPRDPGAPGNLGQTILNSYVAPANPEQKTPFDSPITGIPVAYPTGQAAVADRIYVGDADGTLWRVDITDPDPSNWTARIAFDAYNHNAAPGVSTLGDAWVANGVNKDSALGLGTTPPDTAAAMGQPIQTAPLLSLNEQGDVVVTFATGDQESFSTVSTGMVNIVASFADKFDPVAFGNGPHYEPMVDTATGLGVEVAFVDGARATGQLNLFDGQLYYAYFSPDTTGSCNYGKGGLCAYAYNSNTALKPQAFIDVSGDGPAVPPALPSDQACEDFGPPNYNGDEVVFGVSLNLVPSCSSAPSTFTDPWMAGSYQTVTQSNVGQYQLSMQTGQSSVAPNNAKTPSHKVNLPAPKAKTRVRTWVSVVE